LVKTVRQNEFGITLISCNCASLKCWMSAEESAPQLAINRGDLVPLSENANHVLMYSNAGGENANHQAMDKASKKNCSEMSLNKSDHSRLTTAEKLSRIAVWQHFQPPDKYDQLRPFPPIP